MVFENLDAIVRRWLLETGRPIHYYAEGLYHAATCLRELTMHSLKVVNVKRLPITEYNAVDLPDDFLDDVMLGIPVGGYVRPVPKTFNLNAMRAVDAEGQFEKYPNAVQNVEDLNGVVGRARFFWFWNFSEYGEPLGRFYGYNGAEKRNGYEVFRERRQIQLTPGFGADSVILTYISDGQSVDAASQIDTRAQMSIQTYMEWKKSPNANVHRSYEAQYFYNEVRLMRAKMGDLTSETIKNIVRSNFHASVKN